MSVPVRGGLPSAWNERTAAIVAERLRALEADSRGGQSSARFSLPPSASGSAPVVVIGSPPEVLPSSGDHGALAGLEDADHPQYVTHEEMEVAHVHGAEAVLGIEREFVRRGEAEAHVHHAVEVRGIEAEFVQRGESEAHVHHAADVVGIDAEFARRGEAEAHVHALAEVADFNLWTLMLWQELLGG